MIYLTYNDQPSGIYYSQVIDVCNFVNTYFHCKIRLVALISLRDYSKNRKKIKQRFSNAIVVPMFPKSKNWKINYLLLKFLFFFIGKQFIWSRGIFATNIALQLKKNNWASKVVFDARGAYKAEFLEYLHHTVDVVDDISYLESNAVNLSDFRLVVSQKLLEYWKLNFNYSSNQHVVIPCTLNTSSFRPFPSDDDYFHIKKELGFSVDDIVFVYSGSAASWQSLNLVDNFINELLPKNKNYKFLVLAPIAVNLLETNKLFSEKIIQHWVQPHEVIKYLIACDYGLLIRENSITNSVASPTKYAEYLNAGLKIVISEHLGDLSEFTIQHECGIVIKESISNLIFEAVDYNTRLQNHNLSFDYFAKQHYVEEYRQIIDVANNNKTKT